MHYGDIRGYDSSNPAAGPVFVIPVLNLLCPLFHTNGLMNIYIYIAHNLSRLLSRPGDSGGTYPPRRACQPHIRTSDPDSWTGLSLSLSLSLSFSLSCSFDLASAWQALHNVVRTIATLCKYRLAPLGLRFDCCPLCIHLFATVFDIHAVISRSLSLSLSLSLSFSRLLPCIMQSLLSNSKGASPTGELCWVASIRSALAATGMVDSQSFISP